MVEQVLGLVLLGAYFLPAIIGISRHMDSMARLVFVNLLTGWTIIGWIGCIIWATRGRTREEVNFIRRGGW